MIVARSTDGEPFVLSPVAGLLWDALADWCGAEQLEDCLTARFPDIDPAERSSAIRQTIDLLREHDLVELDVA